MATYNVNRAKHVALTAATVDTVNFAYTGLVVRLHNRDATEYITFTIDGTTPTASGDDTYVLAPGQDIVVDSAGPIRTLKLISAGTPTYDVELY